MATETPNLSTLRTPLGRVRGLGSARGGTHHWWMQRVTSVALLPLTLWFVFAMVRLAGATYVETLLWIARPFNAVLLLALVGLTFHHMASGLQVILEDYVKPEGRRIVAVWLVKGACALMALACVFAILKIAVAA